MCNGMSILIEDRCRIEADHDRVSESETGIYALI